MSGVKFYEHKLFNYFCKPSTRGMNAARGAGEATPVDAAVRPTSQAAPQQQKITIHEPKEETVKPVVVNEHVTTIDDAVVNTAAPVKPASFVEEVTQEKDAKEVVTSEETGETDEVVVELVSEPKKPLENETKAEEEVEKEEVVKETVVENLQSIIDEVLELEYMTGSRDSASLPSMIDLPLSTKDCLKMNIHDLQEPISPSTAVGEGSYQGLPGYSADNPMTKSEELLNLKDSGNETVDNSDRSSTEVLDEPNPIATDLPAKKSKGFFACCGAPQEQEFSTAEIVCV